MKRLHLIAVAFALLAFPASGRAHHIDPAQIVTRAFELFGKNGSNAEMRAILSGALREARQEDALDPSFGIVYAMYADIARFEGNPSFALQLCEQGLDLVLGADTPDGNVRNALLVSRAYALAELGRYEEAIEAARIQVIWMANEFGQESADGLEGETREWAKRAVASDADYRLPAVADLSVKLTDEAREAVNSGDTAKALVLASRALVPTGTGLSEHAVRLLNATAQTVSGVAYSHESRHDKALVAFRRAVDLIVAEPWDGEGKPRLDASLLADHTWRDLAWELFSNLASSASFGEDNEFVGNMLDVAGEFADQPGRRVTLLLQRAGFAFRTRDYGAAEKVFRDAAEDSRASGDEKNALLAEFYVAIARLFQADNKAAGPEIAALAQAARTAATAHGNDTWMTDYVMSTAVKTSYSFRFEHADVAAIVEQAFETFLIRQKALTGYETGQDSVRADRRSFLEIYIGSQYAAEKAKR